MRANFAGFVFDSDTRQLYRGGEPVPLSPKAFELLDLLIRNRPRALSKEEIHDLLWPKTFVSDASLSNLVAELRAAFEDDAANPRLLRTVRRFGYAFIAEPKEDRPSRSVSSYRLLWESREIALSAGETIFGRERDATVWIDDAGVSRRHARIVVADGWARLADLDSKNGTYLNGERLEKEANLSDGDRIQIGRAELTFRAFAETGSTQTRTAASARPAGKPSRAKK
jgi:DNA-binding winged helix-turn-helix (wHTH) protein